MSISPLRQRMIGDMTARHIGESTQRNYIRCVKSFAAFMGRPPETAETHGCTAFIWWRARSAPPV